MHVDGFRFDLAATLARQFHDVDRLSAFFDLVQQDPVVSQVKLIAEPWDLGAGGYQVGRFPPLWSEWNGRYRDTIRDYWRGQAAGLGQFAYRLTGSSDLYASERRRPSASINFVTAHDGFTLADLVSYDHKHNEANGEDNRDGSDDNRSWNCGTEGPTDDADVKALRAQQRRNLLGVGVVMEQKTALRRSVLRTVRPATERSSLRGAWVDRQRRVAAGVAARDAVAHARAPRRVATGYGRA
jgi:isoamylase